MSFTSRYRSILVLLIWLGSIWFPINLSAKILFSEDFENGKLEQWEVIGGTWKVIEIDGNHVVQTKEGANPNAFRTLNIDTEVFGDFTMVARIWQVSQDHGANIYFRNDQSRRNPERHSGYWYGISGALAASGWGIFDTGAQGVWEVAFSEVALDNWVRLKLAVKGKRATMWIAREDVDEDFQQMFEVDNLSEVTRVDFPRGRIGFVVAGGEVWVDDVVISSDGAGLAVKPRSKAAVTWGRLKRFSIGD
jgi:hypothetical protein